MPPECTSTPIFAVQDGLEKGHTPFSREPLRPEQQQAAVLEGPSSPRASNARSTGGTLSMGSIKRRVL